MSNLGDLILSIRDIIPDRTDGEDPHLDGRAFTLTTLLRWINQAGKLITQNAPVIQDWFALSTVAGQDVYAMPEYITSVEQAWFDLMVLERSAEADGIWPTVRSGSSWWFSPHTIHARPRLFLSPAPSTTAATTQLNGAVTDTATTFTVDDTADFNQAGYCFIDDEFMRYANTGTTTTLNNLLRGEGVTAAAAHADNAIVTEGNLILKVYRHPVAVTSADDALEIPLGLHPLLELFVLSKVRSTEQDEGSAMQLRQEFYQAVSSLSDKAAVKGLRQGIQVRETPLSVPGSRLILP